MYVCVYIYIYICSYLTGQVLREAKLKRLQYKARRCCYMCPHTSTCVLILLLYIGAARGDAQAAAAEGAPHADGGAGHARVLTYADVS